MLNLLIDLGRTDILVTLWIELCPPKRCVDVLTRVPQNVTLFGKRVVTVVADD